MESPIHDPQVEAAFCAASDAVIALGAAGLALDGSEAASAQCRRLEAIVRRAQALQLELLGEVDRKGLHEADGHASAKVFVRHAANLSDAESQRRSRSAKAMHAMPLVAAAFRSGAIGRSQVDRIAATYANPRVREAFEDQDANVAVLAMRLPYKEFDQKLTEWEQLEDQDGAGDDAERNHRRRDFAIQSNLDGSKRIDGGCGALQGTEMQTIHAHFVRLEWEADWAEARARVGDAASVADLTRTDAQRRMDAAHAAFRAAADAHAASPGGSVIVTNVVMDHETFERELRRMADDIPGHDARADSMLADLADDLGDGTAPQPEGVALSPTDTDTDTDAATGPGSDVARSGTAAGDAERPASAGRARVGFRSSTIDGAPIPPAEIAAAALLGQVRRVVIGADGVVLDMGRLRRLFTGPQRTAVHLSSTTCVWVGCQVPASQCQADHLDAFNGPRHGSTNPGNGAPLCGRHNRHKERGFTVTRDARGAIHVHRPDGSEIC